jgi:8-oxo-dGTP pyrophosphatase MutT (NUDIX family)
MKTNSNTAPPIAEAATVILTRRRAGGLQIYLLQRSTQSGFMAGNYVFPGGTLDPEDRNTELFATHSDLDLNTIADRFGEDLSPARALAFCVAAIRETLEEAGVFLARHEKNPDEKLAQVCDLRLTAGLEKNWLAKLVAGRGWDLRLTALSRWSHWITPAQMKRRYDTRFFLADMPTGQSCQPDSCETVRGLWISPEEALAANLDGLISLSPPTLVTLHELSEYRDLKDLQADARCRSWGPAISPRLVPLAKGAVIVEPWDPQYLEEEIRIDPRQLPTAVLPVGEPFSRIWYDGKLWRSIRT